MLNKFKIVAANFAVPPKTQMANELALLLDRDERWILENVGVTKRHVCQPGDDVAQLAAQAAEPLIKQHGAPDLLIYASATARQCIPDTSVFVARELGLSGVPTFSVNATCLSFLIAIQCSASMLGAGTYRKILIVSAEQPTLSRDFSQPESAALLGDGAAAVLLESTQHESGLICFRQNTWPEFAELTQIRGGGLLRHPTFPATKDADYLFEMKGEQILRCVIPKLKRFLDQLAEESGINLKKVDMVVPHQASRAGMILLERLGFPAERTVDILSDYGNCVSASIPMALAVAMQQKRIETGQTVLLIGTAAGLSIGAAILRW